MKPSERVRRHGYHLMSLSSIGQLVCFIGWIATLVVGWVVLSRNPAGSEPVANEIWLLACWTGVALLSQLWALGRLRAIGKLLYTGQLIASQMAMAWRQFANALIAVGVLTLLSPEPNAQLQIGGVQGVMIRSYSMGNLTLGGIRIGIDWGQTYFILMACLISYSIAWILDEAVALKDDNQGIV